jgi:hypothetical protein
MLEVSQALTVHLEPGEKTQSPKMVTLSTWDSIKDL